MSHFVSIKTEILDLGILKETLSDLSFRVNEDTSITRYHGQMESVELAVQIARGVFLGFKKDEASKKYLIMGMNLHRPWIQQVIKMIRQEYAYRKVLYETRKRGFSLVQEERVEPGVIKLVLRKVA